ncbi:MAG TPA: C25 family cysteine peptidase, partial [Candidatus Krumholzibacteria bacterium]|nr:C25 family cysteine peptidase [Candidatus Krumholzibacteria bacterium]
MDFRPHRSRSLLLFAFALLAPGLAAVSASGAALEYTLDVPAGSVTIARDVGGDRLGVKDGAFVASTDAGLPVIPYRIASLLLPPGTSVADFTCEATAPVVVAADVRPALVPDAVSTDGSRGSGPALAAWSGGAFPASPAIYLGTGYLHGRAIASFALYPVRLVDGTVAVTERLTLRVETAFAEPPLRVVSRLRHSDRRDARIDERVRGLVVNPEAVSAYSPAGTRVESKRGFRPTSFPSLEGSPVDYVIVTNDSLAAAFQVLADWKTARGVPTVVRTTEWIAANYVNGVDLAETIRTFVIDAYQYWGIEYLLLGGDTGQVPVRFGATGFFGKKDIPVDMYFGCLDGDWNADHDALFGEPGTTDQTVLYHEVYVGRLPATTT